MAIWHRLGWSVAAARRARALLLGGLLVSALSGCACRPAYIGPYGGFHPGRCVVL